MDIDRTAPAIAEGEIRISAPPTLVWEVISDLDGWASWNHDVRSMRFDGPLEPGAVFRWKAGSASIVSTLRVVDPPREIAWTGGSMGIHAVHTFRFEPTEDGTLARSAESFRGLIPTLFRASSRKVLQRGIASILEALKTESERRAAGSNR